MTTEIRCLFDAMVKVKDLKPHPKNRNKHPSEQVDRLAKIIAYQGIRSPIKVSKLSGFITAGHGRLEAFKRLKLKEVPVNYQDYESEEQEYADLQSDNAIASWAELDLSGINMDVGDLGPDFDIDLLGIKDFVLEPAEKFEAQSDEDSVPEHVETICKLGDLWTLGRHRLLCGDSTSIDAVEKLMNGERADMVFTDPPYGINLDTDYTSLKSKRVANKFERVANDEKDFDPGIIFGVFGAIENILLFGANYYADKIPDRNSGSWFVWDKRVTENLDEMYGSAFEMCWSKAARKQEIARVTWAGCFGHNKKDDGAKKVHPTMKPVKLIEWFFERFKGDKVIDPFGGSGSTLIACEKTARRCFMMELDPHYCDVIVARWEKYTGQKAELINGQAS